MYVQTKRNALSRSGPAIAVIGLHVLMLYAVSVSMGIVKLPPVAPDLTAIFVPDAPPEKPKPEPVDVVTPDVANIIDPVVAPLTVVVEDPVVVPVEMPMQPSETAIAGAVAQPEPVAVSAQQLRVTHRVDPVYPAPSRRLEEEGTVQLRVLVDERGRAREVAIAQGSGFARLDVAAIDAVRRWRFAAATDGYNPVTTWTQVSVTFRLTEGR